MVHGKRIFFAVNELECVFMIQGMDKPKKIKVGMHLFNTNFRTKLSLIFPRLLMNSPIQKKLIFLFRYCPSFKEP